MYSLASLVLSRTGNHFFDELAMAITIQTPGAEESAYPE
jgi:hypothetical protein